MNRTELERYVTLYRRSVMGAALCYVKNTADAEDITQEVFLKMYTREESFESDEHAKAWLIRCAVNLGKSLLRSHWHRYSLPLDAAADIPSGESGRDTGEMLQMLKKLGKNNRIALYMHYYEGYTLEETAEILGISPNTVSSRLRRGREQLKKLLTEERNSNDELQRFF